MLKKYVIKRADNHCYEIESEDMPANILNDLRKKYMDADAFSTFTPHVNRLPIAIYELVIEMGRNEFEE